MQQELLAFIPIQGSHTGEAIAEHVYDTLDEFEIKDKFFCITTDNASNNYKMVEILSKLLLERDGIHWDSETCHIPCLAHTINLVVQKFMTNLVIDTDDDSGEDFYDFDEDEDEDDDQSDTVSGIRSIINKIRNIAKSIRSSTSKWERFQTICASYEIKAMTIPLDIKVRWNSTFRMIHQAVFLRKPIHRYTDDLGAKHLVMSDDDWKQAELLFMFLLPFQRCTKRFECNSGHTEIDAVFFAYDTMFNHIENVKKKLAPNTEVGALPCARYMLHGIEKMETVLKKYYSKTELPTVYSDGMILNPRCKLVFFEDESWEPQDRDKYSQGCRRRFIMHYHQTSGSSSSAQTTSSTSAATSSISNATTTRSSLHPQVVVTKRPIDHHAYIVDPDFDAALWKRSKPNTKNDYDRYIEVPNDPSIRSGLAWWKENGMLYPNLARMARDVLAVPASGCAVERQFSISGRMAIWQRNRLSPKVITDSMIYKSALANSRWPLGSESKKAVDDIDVLPVDEKVGHVPEEWTAQWWRLNLGPAITEDMTRLYGSGEEELGQSASDNEVDEEADASDEEDLYG